MISIPEAFAQVIVQIHGQQGRNWLRSLDKKIATSQERWGLEVFQPFDLSYNYVLPVIINNQKEAVLKISLSVKDCLHEIHTLKFYDGQGMCRLIDCDPDQGILLIERLTPGDKLASIKEESTSTAIAVELIKLMKPKRGLQMHSFKTVPDLAVGIRNLRSRYNGGPGPFKEDLLRKVEFLFPELISSQTDTYLLHGDFHHENILQAGENWKLIDPKGVVGEMEYEVVPFLMNNLPGRGAEELIDARVSLFRKELGMSVERIYAWGLCHTLLSAWWNIEDNLGLSKKDLAILKHLDAKVP